MQRRRINLQKFFEEVLEIKNADQKQLIWLWYIENTTRLILVKLREVVNSKRCLGKGEKATILRAILKGNYCNDLSREERERDKNLRKKLKRTERK